MALWEKPLFISLRLNKIQWLKSVCSTSPNRTSLQSILQSFLNLSSLQISTISPIFMDSFLSKSTKSYIFISRVFSYGGALSIFTLGTICMDGAMETIRDSFEAIFTFALTLTHDWKELTELVTHGSQDWHQSSFISWILTNFKQWKAKLLKEKI